MRTSTEKLAAALHVLANDIQSDDGVANAAILEAALRLEEQDQRIKQLIAERDTARMQADQKVSLREEFRELLGTDKIEEGVAAVTVMKERIKQLEDRIKRASIAFFADGSDRQTATGMLSILEEERNKQ